MRPNPINTIITAFRLLLQGFKWIIIIILLLFALATFMGKSYLQTIILLLAAVAMVYWPPMLQEKWKTTVSTTIRLGVIFICLFIGFIVFQQEPKQSIYLNKDYQEELMAVYEKQMKNWPAETKDKFIETQFGTVHVLTCGADTNPPLLMFHAASMGAHSWAENIAPLISRYQIYSVDNIGEGNKSQLKNALVFPKTGKDLADLYAQITDSLKINKAPVIASSNGGFVAMNYVYYYPERVESLVLLGPMGLTPLSNKSIMMLSIATMYPFQFVRNIVTEWAIGNAPYTLEHYGEWFDCILRGTIPSLAKPIPMTTTQKKEMKLPILLFLGTKDPIVGDAVMAEQTAKEFPNISIEILDSGHLIAVERKEDINKKIAEFLDTSKTFD